MSVLFVDLVGFTSRSEKLDPEDVRAFLVPYYERVRGELESHGGKVEKFVGDAVMGIFGAPVTYGDDAERAVRAAFAVRDWAEDEGLQLRVAVNTGEAIVALDASPERGETFVAGDVVNTAARLQSASPVGAVLVGEETYIGTRGSIEYRPAQPVVAKGKETPVQAWLALRATSAIGERPAAPVPMVGRDRELAVLTGVWDRVVDEGRSHFVTVFGPAGIGKSRIALELAQLVAAQGARVIRGRSTPYGASSPYSAFGQQVKQIARIFDSDDAAEATEKLTDAIASLAGPAAAEEHAPNLATLLGLDGDREAPDREQLFFSARVLVESLALGGPTLLVYEDIHWADASLLDLLETFAARVRDVPRALPRARATRASRRPAGLGRWSARVHGTSAGAARRRCGSRARRASSSGESTRRRAQSRSLKRPRATRSSSRSSPDASASSRSRGSMSYPRASARSSRRDSTRFRRRSAPSWSTHRVVGRVFWRGALSEIDDRSDLSDLLGSLEGRDLIQREAVSRIKGDQQFGFKHGLIHDVAYATLPRAARRAKHAAVARFLEAATDVGQSHEALGHHWQEAGENERALEHLTAAADQAGRGWAKQRAVALYREALEVLADDDARRRDVTRKLAVALQAAYHLGDVGGVPAGEPG